MAVWVVENGLDCRKCTEQLKKVRGCYGFGRKVVIDGVEVDRCPAKVVKGGTMIYLQAYRMLKMGFLPNRGSWLEQPAKFIDAMDVIDKYMEERREDGKC